MNRSDWLASLSLLTLAIDCITCEIIELGNSEYYKVIGHLWKKMFPWLFEEQQ